MVTVGAHVVEDDALQGAVFDVDGTLLDTMPLFYPAWPETGALPQFGLQVTEDEFYKLGGKPLADIVQVLHTQQKGTPASEEFVSQFLKEKIRRSEGHEAKQGHPPAIDSVVAIARKYKESGVPIAIATSGIRDIALSHLRHAGIADLVPEELMVFAADVARGKPDPAIYFEAARRLGVDPSKCRAYEDAENGLRSAHAAGMQVIDVTFLDGYPRSPALARAKEHLEVSRSWLQPAVGKRPLDEGAADSTAPKTQKS